MLYAKFQLTRLYMVPILNWDKRWILRPGAREIPRYSCDVPTIHGHGHCDMSPCGAGCRTCDRICWGEMTVIFSNQTCSSLEHVFKLFTLIGMVDKPLISCCWWFLAVVGGCWWCFHDTYIVWCPDLFIEFWWCHWTILSERPPFCEVRRLVPKHEALAQDHDYLNLRSISAALGSFGLLQNQDFQLSFAWTYQKIWLMQERQCTATRFGTQNSWC